MLRQRRREECSFSPESQIEEKEDICTRGVHRFSTVLAAVVIICSWFLLYYSAVFLNERLPQIQSKADIGNEDRFIGARAKEFLIKLAAIGIKTTGSYENEIKAAELIETEIESIILQAKKINDIKYDRQVTSGSFYLDQRHSFLLSVYNKVQNLVVKIGPPDGSANETSSVLINCHFDSAPASPGASDDGLNCAVMIEVLRLLSQQNSTMKNSVIFLFNGAEETPLQASHGFITHHEWAKDIRAFINLESCGAGGKESLFQTGPQHPWLVQIYKDAVQHPFGLVLAEDIFQGGLVPSDTDFRIFRDFGHIPGLDFAHCDNGFVYHTRFDDIDRITDGVYQHTGDNLLALTKQLASSDLLDNTQNHKQGRMVYFDLIGLYLVTYSDTAGVIINLATALLSFYIILQNTFIYTQGMKRVEVGKQLVLSLLVPTFGLLLAFLFVISIAVVLDVTNAVMSWYSKPLLILPLYFAPTLVAFCLPPLLFNRFKSSNISAAIRVQLYINGVQLLWTIVLFIAVLTGLRSAYVLMIAVLITTIANCLLYVINMPHNVTKWLIGYCTSSIIPAFYFVYIYILAIKLFIPITGRIGPNINPELFIGVLAMLLCSLTFAYITPVILLVWKPWRLLSALLIINVSTLLLVILTPVGFPFAENTPQRILAMRVGRTFYNESGAVVKSDSGTWLTHLDRRAPGTYDLIPGFNDAVNIDSECSKYLYCGLPYYYTRIASVEKNPGSWIPGAPPSLDDETHLKLRVVEDISTTIKRFTFNMSGPHQILLFLCPKEGVKLVGWDFGKEEPNSGLKWGSRPTYIVRYVKGGFPGVPETTFNIDIKVDEHGYNLTSYMDIAIAGHYIEHMTEQRDDLMKPYPSSFLSWAHVTTWSASFKSYVF